MNAFCLLVKFSPNVKNKLETIFTHFINISKEKFSCNFVVKFIYFYFLLSLVLLLFIETMLSGIIICDAFNYENFVFKSCLVVKIVNNYRCHHQEHRKKSHIIQTFYDSLNLAKNEKKRETFRTSNPLNFFIFCCYKNLPLFTRKISVF